LARICPLARFSTPTRPNGRFGVSARQRAIVSETGKTLILQRCEKSPVGVDTLLYLCDILGADISAEAKSMTLNTTHTHEIDPRSMPPSKSRDRLKVRYNRKLSLKVTQERGHEVSVYDVVNLDAMTAYKVEFSVVNGRKLGGCTCESRKVCKHLTRSVFLHVYRKSCERRAASRAAALGRQPDDAALWRSALA